MMKVKGHKLSLTEAKATGGNVKILYSPLSAVKIAIKALRPNLFLPQWGLRPQPLFMR